MSVGKTGRQQMAAFEKSKSRRIEIDNGDGYTSIRVISSKFKDEYLIATLLIILSVALIFDATFNYTKYIAQDPDSITLLYLYIFAPLFIGLVILFKAVAHSARRETLVLTDKLLLYLRKGFFVRHERSFDAGCIRDLSVLPDVMTRPVAGRPYGRNELHVEFMHAGESIRVFKDLMHAEARLVATTIANRLAATGKPASKVVTVEFNAANLGGSGSEFVPGASGNGDRNSAVQTVLRNGIRYMRVKPAIDIPKFFLFLVATYWLIKNFNLHGLQKSVHYPFSEFNFYLLLLLYFIASFFVAYSFSKDLLDAFRREHVSVEQNVLSHQIRRLLPGSTRYFDRSRIAEVRIVTDTSRCPTATDFQTLPAFHVSFDYGEITHHLGCRLRYADAQKLCELILDELDESKVAA